MNINSVLNQQNYIIDPRNPVGCCGNPLLQTGQKSPSDPEIWGPRLWSILYFFILKLNSKETLIKIHRILDNLSNVLPCNLCNSHVQMYKYRKPLQKLEEKEYSDEEILIEKNKLFLWAIKLQNIVRYNHKKEIYIFTIDSLNEYYKNNPLKSNTFRFIYSVFLYHNDGLRKAPSPILKQWLRDLEELKIEFVKED